jgi:hypothetical protein
LVLRLFDAKGKTEGIYSPIVSGNILENGKKENRKKEKGRNLGERKKDRSIGKMKKDMTFFLLFPSSFLQ